MFKKELLIVMLLSSLIANLKNDIGYKQIKNIIYQNYKIICNKEIYYLNEQDKVMFNFDNMGLRT